MNDVSLDVPAGEFISIMGASGSGKSTLLHLIGGLDRSTSGDVSIEGLSLASLSDDRLADVRRERIGFIFQQFNLLPTLTALENATLPMLLAGKVEAEGKAFVKELLGLFGLSARLDHLPEELSGGEMQRVAIARALCMRPAIVLADEPTGNLDSKTGLEILDLLSDCREQFKQTIVMVTHDVEAAAYGDRVVTLKDGTIADS